MKKKAATKKITGKTKKKTAEKKTAKRKLKAAPEASKKPAMKKKETKKEKVKIKEVTPPKKTIKEKTKKIAVEVKPKKTAKKVAPKVEVKPIPSIIKEVKEVSLPRKVAAKKPEKVHRPVLKEKYPPGLAEILPTEYGEDSITLMTVDPMKLFAYWEILENTILRHEGILAVRFFDVTGIDFDGMNAHSYFDIPVNERIGSRYIDVSPEREFIADIGFINPAGLFTTTARSRKVSTPRRAFGEEGIPGLYETGISVGY